MKSTDPILSPIAGYSVTRLPIRPPSNGCAAETHPFTVISAEKREFTIDLYALPGMPPHGWEATQPNTTNAGEYYSTGGLSIVPTTGELEDFDGVFFLPRCVAVVLRSLGFIVSNDCLADPLPVK